MQNIRLDHWFINGNVLSISLTQYYVSIDTEILLLMVIDSNQKKTYFDFDSVEMAVSFTETVIAKSFTLDGIKEAYNKYYGDDKSKTFTKRLD